MDVPSEGLEILGFRWSPGGEALLLLTKDKVCCCYLSEPEEDRDIGSDGDLPAAGVAEGADGGVLGGVGNTSPPGESGEGEEGVARSAEEHGTHRGVQNESEAGVVPALGV